MTLGLASKALLTQAQSTTSPEVKSGFAEINGGRLYYEVAGQGHPLVLIHGGQMDSRIWDEQYALFAQSYRVIRYDFRGFGKSPASANVFAGEDDLAGLLTGNPAMWLPPLPTRLLLAGVGAAAEANLATVAEH